jgi:hypothetical protein
MSLIYQTRRCHIQEGHSNGNVYHRLNLICHSIFSRKVDEQQSYIIVGENVLLQQMVIISTNCLCKHYFLCVIKCLASKDTKVNMQNL